MVSVLLHFCQPVIHYRLLWLTSYFPAFLCPCSFLCITIKTCFIRSHSYSTNLSYGKTDSSPFQSAASLPINMASRLPFAKAKTINKLHIAYERYAALTAQSYKQSKSSRQLMFFYLATLLSIGNRKWTQNGSGWQRAMNHPQPRVVRSRPGTELNGSTCFFEVRNSYPGLWLTVHGASLGKTQESLNNLGLDQGKNAPLVSFEVKSFNYPRSTCHQPLTFLLRPKKKTSLIVYRLLWGHPCSR